MLSLNIIGAGKLGKTLGFLLNKRPEIHIQDIINRNLSSSKKAINFIGSGSAVSSIADLRPADITLIAVPDNNILSVVKNLSTQGNMKANSIVFHCSGQLSSEILRTLSVHVMSLHPIKSFASIESSVSDFSGTICTYEGDAHAQKTLIPIFEALGAICMPIAPNLKSRYHAGCVLASNYLITLAANAANCLQDSGINEDTALDITLNLMQNTIDNLKKTRSAQNALTGPLERGDDETIHHHLLSLKNSPYYDLYQLMGILTLKLTKHDNDIIERLLRRLKKN